MFVVGTVGHVDHGKSSLVEALTGMDPDRLPVEKQRGMTTDLGFAWVTLPSGRDVSIVDVPGHERYIKNMLAGSGGVDLALIVIAADDGPMAQTREHVAILELLGVSDAICVITKTDLVEADYLDLVDEEIGDALAKTPFAAAPRLRTSARTGEGLPELVRAIDISLDGRQPRIDTGRPRLPVDRVFTIKGFGTVVTGTLAGGSLASGQQVELQPGAHEGRVRGLQRHGSAVESAGPGTRLAVNVTGDAAEYATRGMVLALPGSMTVASIADLRVSVPASVAAALRHNQGVTVLCGTAESEARLRLLDADEIGPAESGWAQVVLETPMALEQGDRCILRTPSDTVAGGVVVAINPRRHRRHHAATLATLDLAARGSPSRRLLDLLTAGPVLPSAIPAALALTADESAAAAAALLAEGTAVEAEGRLFAGVWLQAAKARMLAAVAGFLDANPLRAAAPREHLRSVAKLDRPAFAAAVTLAMIGGELVEAADGLTLPGRVVALPQSLTAVVDRFLQSLAAGVFAPPTDDLPEPAVLAYLAERALVTDTGLGIVYDPAVYKEIERRVVAYLDEHGSISLGEMRDLFGTSRKYAQPTLEYMDALKITRRVGESRVLLRRPAQDANDDGG